MVKLYFDRERCLGCHTCEFVCAVEHSESRHPGRAHLEKKSPIPRRRIVVVKGRLRSRSCNHCDKPRCIGTCPEGAFVKNDDGMVTLDTSKCTRCWECVEICPFDAVWKSEAFALKCDLCPDLAADEFACVTACPTGALIAATPEDYKKIMAERKKAKTTAGP